MIWFAWFLVGVAIVALLFWSWQIADLARDATRSLKEIREILDRVERKLDADDAAG